MKGCIHLYCGEGKGKTTAAIGLAIRGAGAGIPVIFCQFMKTDSSSEIKILKEISQIQVLHGKKQFGFSWKLSESEKTEAFFVYTELLERAIQKAEKKNQEAEAFKHTEDVAAILILDEVLSACEKRMVDQEKIMRWLERKPDGIEVVLTGRNPSEELIKRSDYVTEMKKIKHPYERGISARKGIEW